MTDYLFYLGSVYQISEVSFLVLFLYIYSSNIRGQFGIDHNILTDFYLQEHILPCNSQFDLW